MQFSYSIDDRLTPRHKFIMNFCGDLSGKTILDIGCSFGWFEKFAIDAGAKKIVGIEPKKEYFHNADREITKAEFVTGSADKLPFPDKYFDMVIVLEVLEHLPPNTEQKTIEEISRVLKPNGELILSTPNKHFLSCLLDPAWYFGHRHYSLHSIEELLKKDDFVVQNEFIYGGFWELFRMIPHYFFKWVFKSEDPLKNFFEKKMIPDSQKPDNYAYIYIKAKKNE